MGRKKQPTVLRLVAATQAPSAVNPDEPVIETSLGAAPSWMTARQRAIWDAKIAECPEGMLRSLDLEVLASFCVAAASMVEYEIEIQKLRKHTITTKKGNVIQNPLIGMRNRQMLITAKLGSELGFSATSRARVKVAKGSGSKNPFAEHAARRAKQT